MPRHNIQFAAGRFIATIICIIVAVTILVMWLFGLIVLFNAQKDARITTTRLAATEIDNRLSLEMDYLKALVDSPIWRPILEEKNAAMSLMTDDERTNFFAERDKLWAVASDEDPVIRQYLDNPLSRRLQELSRDLPYINEIFITDRYGGLIAAASRTTDYYQADEEWWQKASLTKPGIYIEGMVYDVSSDASGLSLAIPIIYEDKSLAGVCKINVNTQIFWGFIDEFKVGLSGRVLVIDRNGRPVSGKPTEMLKTQILPPAQFAKLFKNHYLITDRCVFRKGFSSLFYQVLTNMDMKKSGLRFGVIIEQPLAEFMTPFRNFIGQIAIFTAIILLCAAVFGWLAGSRLAYPIVRMKNWMNNVMTMGINQPIYVGTGDELEDVASFFNDIMVKAKSAQEIALARARELEKAYDKINHIEDRVRTANIDLTNLKSELAKKIGERTHALVETQEAIINMMEDLQESKDQIEEAHDEIKGAYDELKETQRRLVQSEKMAALGRFSAGIAHEVKNPLAIILGGMEYLDMKLAATTSDVKNVIVKIKDAVLRADAVLQNLLKFARPAKLEMERIRPGDMVNEVLGLFRYKFPLINIEIATDYGDPDLLIYVDKNQLQQVFFNLLINSMDAMPGGGVIYITVTKEYNPEMLSGTKTACVITLKDTGGGIAKDDLARIFEPFFTTKRDKGGTGLGLAVAKSIIDSHSGALAIESEVGKGTIVKVILPIERKGDDVKYTDN